MQLALASGTDVQSVYMRIIDDRLANLAVNQKSCCPKCLLSVRNVIVSVNGRGG